MKQTKKILVIEDEKPLLNILSETLTEEGFHVLQASNGEQGLALAIAEKPDLVLLDIIMPGMSGLDVLIKLRTQETWGHTVPVILLTNVSIDRKRIEAVSQYDTYLIKAETAIIDIVNTVRRLLGLAIVEPSKKSFRFIDTIKSE